MAANSFYKFINPGGVAAGPKGGGRMSIGGQTYARKRNAEQKKDSDSGRKLVLSGNRLGLVLNEQTTILKGIKTSIDNSTKASIRNVKVINQSLKDIKKEERIAKIKARKKDRDERKEKNRLAREERIKKSRERLGAREGALEAKPAGGGEQGEGITFAKKGGFFDNLGKFIKLLLTFAALKWLSNPGNAKMVARFLLALVKVLKVIYRVVEFGVVKILEGFTNLFGSDSSFFDRLKGFLQFLTGALSLFFTIRWLKNPLKILADARKLFKVFKVIPKAIGLVGKLAKGIVLATKAGVSKMKGIGGIIVGGATLLGGGALISNMMGGDDTPKEPTTPPPPAPAPKEPAPAAGEKREPAKAESGAIIPIIPDLTGFDSVPAPRYSMESGGTVPAPRYSMAGGGIVPFRGMSRRASAQRGRIISGRNQGYSAQVGGQTIEAHGTEAVIPIKNRYTDSGNDPIAALVGNSKKMAEGMGALIPLPMKLIGGSILVGLGSLLGMAPFGIGGMLAPFAKTLLSPILSVFGIPEDLLDKAMNQAGGKEKGKDFASAISEPIKDWFGKILPGGSVGTTPSAAPPGPSPGAVPPSPANVGDAVDIGTKTSSGSAVDPSASRNILEWDPNKTDYKSGEVVKMEDGSLRQYDGQGWSEFKPEGQGAVSGGNWKPVLDLIAEGESNTSGGYDAMNPSRNTRAEGNPITEMTMRQVRDMAMKSSGTGAAGRYQIMPEFRGSNVFKKLVEDVGLDYDKDKFTPANQDKMAIHRLEVTRRGNDWLAGKYQGGDVAFANNLANEWAALKKSHGGGNYDNDGRNAATIDQSRLIKALQEVKGGAQRMNHGGTVTPQRMFLGGIGKAISGAVSSVGKFVSGALNSPIGKMIGTAASFIPGVGPIMAGVNAVAGMMSGNPMGALMSGLNMIPGLGGIGETIGGFLNSPLGQMGSNLIGGLMGGDIMGAMGGMGNILAQGGEMIFGPGFTQMFGGTLDLLNVGGKGLGASDFLKKMGGGLMDFGVKQLAGAMGGPDAKQAMVPGGSTVLNVNAVRMIGALMKTQVVQQNAAKIKGLEGVTQMMGDKMVKLTGDVISGVLLDKGSVAELPPQVMDQAMAQILPMIHNAITSASAAASQQALGSSSPSGGGKMDPGSLARSAAGSALTSGVSGTLSALAGKITGTGIR